MRVATFLLGCLLLAGAALGRRRPERELKGEGRRC